MEEDTSCDPLASIGTHMCRYKHTYYTHTSSTLSNGLLTSENRVGDTDVQTIEKPMNEQRDGWNGRKNRNNSLEV